MTESTKNEGSVKQSLIDEGKMAFSVCCDGRPTSAPPVTVETERKVFREDEAVEWRLRLRNDGSTDSPLLSDICVLDLTVPVGQAKPVVWHSRGCGGSSPFLLGQTTLMKGDSLSLNNPGGGKTKRWLPFFNLQSGDRGIIGAVGWPGRWQIFFSHRDDGNVRVTAGMERAQLALRPGEQISTPRVLLMFWEGDRLAAHNRFRQLILRHYSPDVPDLMACPSWGGMKTRNHLRLIETIRRHKLPYDCYWIDAGWYGAPHETDEYQNLKTEDWYFHVGDWRVNTCIHPDGLKPVSDAAHAAGMKFLLWFEPERVLETSPLFLDHPEWCFKRSCTGNLMGRTCRWRCFNFGNPSARRWMTEWIAGRITELGIDVFRQDCNFGPAQSWDDEDVPGRAGMSEIRYVEGLGEFWDELRRRFPHLVLDIVQRRDLDSISRGTDLTRSDHEFLPHTDVMASQGAMYALAHWTPLSGNGPPHRPGWDYDALSVLASSFVTGPLTTISDVPVKPEPSADYPWDWLRNVLETDRRARPFFRGDFFPLLEHTVLNEHWSAVQFHRQDLDAGMVLVYRRPNSPFTTARFCLRGLSKGQAYNVETVGGPAQVLTDNTLDVVLQKAPSAAVMFYSRW